MGKSTPWHGKINLVEKKKHQNTTMLTKEGEGARGALWRLTTNTFILLKAEGTHLTNLLIILHYS